MNERILGAKTYPIGGIREAISDLESTVSTLAEAKVGYSAETIATGAYLDWCGLVFDPSAATHFLGDFTQQQRFWERRIQFDPENRYAIANSVFRATKSAINLTQAPLIGLDSGLAGQVLGESIASHFGLGLKKYSADEVAMMLDPINDCQTESSVRRYSFLHGMPGLITALSQQHHGVGVIDWKIRQINHLLEQMKLTHCGLFVDDGGRLLPYLECGSAGVLLSMLSVPLNMWPETWFSSLPALLDAIIPTFTLNVGMGSGAAGLILVGSMASILLEDRSIIVRFEPLVEEILTSRLAVFEWNDRNMLAPFGEGQLALTLDYWSGAVGLYIALSYYVRLLDGEYCEAADDVLFQLFSIRGEE